MVSSLYRRSPYTGETSVLKTAYHCLESVQSVKDGVLRVTSTMVVRDPARDNAEFKSTDFSIGNIIAVGATDMLKPCFVSKDSDMNYVDQFENLIQTANND